MVVGVGVGVGVGVVVVVVVVVVVCTGGGAGGAGGRCLCELSARTQQTLLTWAPCLGSFWGAGLKAEDTLNSST